MKSQFCPQAENLNSEDEIQAVEIAAFSFRFLPVSLRAVSVSQVTVTNYWAQITDVAESTDSTDISILWALSRAIIDAGLP